MVLAKLNCGYCLTIKYTVQANILLNYGSTLYRQIYCLVMEVIILFLYLWEFGTVCCCGIAIILYMGTLLWRCCGSAVTVGMLLYWTWCFCGDRAFVAIYWGAMFLYWKYCCIIHVIEVLLWSAFMRMLLDGSPVILMVVRTIFVTTVISLLV